MLIGTYKSPLAREKLLDFRTMLTHYYTYFFFKNFYPERRLRIIAYLWSMFGIIIGITLQHINAKKFCLHYWLLAWYFSLFFSQKNNLT